MIGNNNQYWIGIRDILKLVNSNYIGHITRESSDSHQIIETLMIIYNKFATKYLINKIKCLYLEFIIPQIVTHMFQSHVTTCLTI